MRISDLFFDSHQSTKVDTSICRHIRRLYDEEKVFCIARYEQYLSLHLWLFVCVLGESRLWT